MTESVAQIWKKLTPSQRVTLLNEAGVRREGHDVEAEIRAGLRKRGDTRAEWSSGSARHALGRKGLLDIRQTVPMPTSAAGFHTPREITALGRAVADHGLAILRGSVAHSRTRREEKKAPARLDAEVATVLRQRQRRSRLRPVEGLRIPADAHSELIRFWRAHPALREGCLSKYGFDPIDEEADYWRFGLAESDHADVLRAVRGNGGLFSLAHVKRWETEELRDA